MMKHSEDDGIDLNELDKAMTTPSDEARAKELLWDILGDNDHIQIQKVIAFIAAVREEAYIDGLTAYAHWKDGRQLVGTCGTTLQSAIELYKAAAIRASGK